MIRLAIVAVCSVIGIGAAIRSRFGSLLFYVWFAMFRPTDYLWFSIAEYRPSLLVGLTLVGSSALTGVLPMTSHGLWLGSVMFWVLGLMAQHYAVAPDLGWEFLFLLGTLIVVSALIVRLTTTTDRLYTLIAVLAGSFAFFSAKAGFSSLLNGGARYWEGLATGAYSDSNGYAVGCVMVIPLLIALAQTSRRQWVKLGWLAAALSTGFTVISTFSRGGFLAMAIGAFVLILLNPRPMRKLAAVAALSIVAIAVVPIPDGYLDRLYTIETYDEIEEESALGRLHIWSVALDMARDHPMGIGLWNFESVYDRYDPDGSFGENRAVHNSHLQALVEAGWIGGAVWECLIFGGLLVAWRTRQRAATLGERASFFRTMANAFIASQVGFLVGGTFVSMAYNDLTWLGFGCVAALDRLAASETALVQEPSASFALQGSGPRMVPARLPNRVNIGARR